jgi:hypothetical protein
MPKIPSYPLAVAISNEDLLVMDDASAQYATKSLELQLLKGFINTGQATTTYVADQVVTGASFNTGTGVLTLTRNGGEIPSVTTNLDGRYYLASNPNSYTSNLGVVQALTTTGTSGAATLVGGTLNIPQYSSGSTGSYLTFTRTFTGNELVNAFNGNPSDNINLVSVPNNKIAIVIEAVIIIKAASTGTTNYNANASLYIQPSGANSVWGVLVPNSSLNVSTDFVQFGIESGASTALSTAGGAGADIVLAPGGSPCSITQGDRDVLLSVTYRLLDI